MAVLVHTFVLGGEGEDREDEEQHENDYHKENDPGQIDIEYGEICKGAERFTEDSNADPHVDHCERGEGWEEGQRSI